MKKIYTVLFLSFFIFQNQNAGAQRPGGPGGRPDGPPPAIVGKVVDGASQMPLEFATVTLFSLPDSSMVTGTVTAIDGTFSIGTRPGKYYAEIEFIAYGVNTVGGIEVGKGNVDLGSVSLTAQGVDLGEVEVRAEKSTMQLSLDKKVFNVGKDLANSSRNAADVLDNVPSVTVDVEGNVELRGNGSVRILIDGKPSGLVGVGDAQGLQNLPANLIDRVEVITNPGARYEAEGMAGILNIVLKKERKKGINGSFDVTTGWPQQYGLAANMNMRRNRFNFFTNYSIRYREGWGRGNQFQEFFEDGETYITDNRSRRDRTGLSNNFRFGADYFFNDKNILTTAFNYSYGKDDNFNTIKYLDYVGDLNNLTRSTRRTDNEFEKEPKLEYSVDYRKMFGRKGHELTARASYQDNVEDEGSDLDEFNVDLNTGQAAADPFLRQRSRNKEGEKNIIFQVDYTQPFSDEGKFEAGLRTGLREVSNDFAVTEEVADGVWEPLVGLNNNIIYDEDIYAAYSNVGNNIGKFSWLAGARLEYTDVKTDLKQTGEVNPRDYLNLFPSATLGYELNERNSLSVSYSRRIRRPRFWELNPFFTFTDRRNFWAGNPDLNPEYTNSFEVGYLKYFEKGSLTLSPYYRHTTGVVQRLRIQETDTTSVTRPQNLAEQDDYGLELTFNYEPMKNWRINGNANFFRSETIGRFNEQDLSAEANTMTGRLSTRITFWKKIDLQINFNYRAPRNTTQGRRLAIWHVDPAASMDILKGNATVALSVRDLFNTRRRRYITEGDNFRVEGDWRWRARSTVLTFSYRLNKKKERRRGGGDFGGGGEGGF